MIIGKKQKAEGSFLIKNNEVIKNSQSASSSFEEIGYLTKEQGFKRLQEIREKLFLKACIKNSYEAENPASGIK